MTSTDTTPTMTISISDMLGNEITAGDTIVYPSGRYARRLVIAEVLSITSHPKWTYDHASGKAVRDGYSATIKALPKHTNLGSVNAIVVTLHRWDNVLKVAVA